MGELLDKLKGRIKELAGVASGDRSLEFEGKADTVKGDIKGRFERAKQKVKEETSEQSEQHPIP